MIKTIKAIAFGFFLILSVWAFHEVTSGKAFIPVQRINGSM